MPEEGHHDHDGHDHGNHEGHDHEGHDHDDHGHDDHEGHDHHDHGHGGHSHAHDLREAGRRNLLISLVLIVVYMVAEIVGGILSGSLALLSDAGHMATDAAAIGLALLAMWIADREASPERTFGYYRMEVLAALLNVVALWVIVGYICYEAYVRFTADEAEISNGLAVLLVGLGGLIVNIIVAFVLHRSSGHSMNAEGAFQHVIADLLGSVGVVVSAILIMTLGWHLSDPILSVIIGLLILLASRGLMLQVLHVLLEGTPEHIDVYELCSDIEQVEGVTLIHDVHVWTITSQSEAFSAHVLVDPDYGGHVDEITKGIQSIVHNKHRIGHATIQVEATVEGCLEDHHVGHLMHRSQAEREAEHRQSFWALFER